MEELIKDYKDEVQDPEQFERLMANYLYGEIEQAIEYVVDAIQDDLDIDLFDMKAHYDIRNYLKCYLQHRASNTDQEDPWFRQKVLR